MDRVVLCDSRSHLPQLVDLSVRKRYGDSMQLLRQRPRDTFALQHPYESLPYVDIRELTPASQTSLIGCVLLAVGLASAVGADSERVDD